MQPDEMIAASANAVARKVGGETVLLDLESGTYFGLNAVGSFIWALIEKEPHSLASLAEAVAADFDVTRDEALRDITALAQSLAENGLLKSD